MKNKLSKLMIAVALFIVSAVPAFAHVIVYPSQVGVAATQEFSMSVPNEKDNPTVAIRLLIPDGLSSVVPNVAPGWNIDIKSSGSGDNAVVTEIDWSGGSIPVGQREDFLFKAQVPAKSTTLAWKVYQTYSDGTIVTWIADPSTMSKMTDAQQDKMVHDENKGPYSQTKIVNDLTSSPKMSDDTKNNNNAMLLSGIAIVLSLVAIGLQVVKKSK